MSTITQTTTKSEPRYESSDEKLYKETALTGNFKWEDLLIPETTGKGSVKRYRQLRTLVGWALASTAGFCVFYTSKAPSVRAAALGVVFPGAGLFAVGTVPSMVLFALTMAGIPLVLFAWFGAGGLFFPIALWTGSAVLAALLAQDSLIDLAAPIWLAICVGGIAYIAFQTQNANNEAQSKRKSRNDYLINTVRENQMEARKIPPGSRELDLRTLRFLQWSIELGLTPKDDFSYHDIIDQFQTSAIRYQLYEAVSDIGLYQYIYAPNFHGYASQAQRNCIEKSLTERVVGFWKWESSWGKFKFSDWDPIREDDIMVSGYVLQAVGIYQSNTGDERYCQPGSLTFDVSPKHKYPYDFKSIADAVYRNWDEGPYCLFSCEPNWIYTMCNLTGASGITLAARLLNVGWGEKIKKRFEKALAEEFTQQDGTIMTIRSELTGYTIPGLAGRLADAINSLLCAGFLPNVAHRSWAFVKKEAIKWKDDGSIELVNLVGADRLDAGNYKPGEGFLRGTFACAAAEYGDLKIRDQLLKELDEQYHPVFTTKTGAFKNKGLSTLAQGGSVKGRMAAYQDWADMITKGPPENAFKGPILEDAPFPDILVAKAWSHDGEGMELVVYPGKDSGEFQLGFTRLKPGQKYSLDGASGKVFAEANKDGKASFAVSVDGRTAFNLVTGD